MELFFYGLCSKAGFSNLSVVPARSDTCATRPGELIGIGSVATVTATVRGRAVLWPCCGHVVR